VAAEYGRLRLPPLSEANPAALRAAGRGPDLRQARGRPAQQADFAAQPSFAANGAADAALNRRWLAPPLARDANEGRSPRMSSGHVYWSARVRREVGL
jgi:hypothetical protein